jgi:hypothetical protein
MAKTYVPTLRLVVNTAYKYGTRWQSKLEQSLTTTQYTCLTTWLSATLALILCLGTPPPNP